MGSTPTYSLPYPEASDAPDGPTQIAALATAVDNALGTRASAASVAANGVRLDALELRKGATATITQSYTTDATLYILGGTTGGSSGSWVSVDDQGGFLTVGATTTPFVVPSGQGGLYSISGLVAVASIPTGRTFVDVLVNGVASARNPINAGETQGSTSITLPLAAGATVGLELFHTKGNAIATTANGTFRMYKVGP